MIFFIYFFFIRESKTIIFLLITEMNANFHIEINTVSWRKTIEETKVQDQDINLTGGGGGISLCSVNQLFLSVSATIKMHEVGHKVRLIS